MTRTDVMASSRPRTPDAAPNRRTRGVRRALLALPIVLLMSVALLVPGTALAAETTTTSGYAQEPPKPTTTTTTTPTTTPTPTTTTTPSTGTSPSKEESTKTTTTSKEPTPTTTTAPAKEAAKTLPFTGFDLRWSFAIGLALIAAGFSIVLMQRRRRAGQR